MQVSKHLIFLPTPALLRSAREFGCADDPILRLASWTVIEHDRVGPEYAQETIEQSFWAEFLAWLFEEEPESERAESFRESCIALGFGGCWEVQIAGSGGDAADLIASANEARTFLRARGIVVP